MTSQAVRRRTGVRCGPAPSCERRSAMRLAGLARPAAAARRRTRVELAAWGLSASLVDTAELVVAELAANAEQHAAGPLELRLALYPCGVLLVGIRDADTRPTETHPPAPAPDAESGRGLDIVAALAQAHGITYAPDHKYVWATLPAFP